MANSGTPLHAAILLGECHRARLLLLEGAEVDAPNKNGKTALMLAVARNDPSAVSLLLQFGASIDAKDHNGEGALHLAFKSNDTFPDLTKQLLLRIQSQYPNTNELLEILFEAGCHLYHAAILGNVEVMRGLLKRGVIHDVNSTYTTHLTTALHVAVESRKLPLVTCLLNAGANPNSRDAFGCTALYIAASFSEPSILKSLLERGANPNVEISYECIDIIFRPLTVTYSRQSIDVRSKSNECTELLLLNGAELPLQDRDISMSLLDEALFINNHYKVNLLICYVALQEMKGFKIAEMVLLCHHPGYQIEYRYEKCQNTLRMNVTKEFTIFDLLSVNKRKFRAYVRQRKVLLDEVDKFLTEHQSYLCKNYGLFKYYYLALKDRLDKTPTIDLERDAMTILCRIFNGNYNSGHIYVREILEHLDKSDFEILCKV